MAIKDNTNQPEEKVEQRVEPQVQQQQYVPPQSEQPQQQQPKRNRFSFRSAGMFSPIQRMVGSEFYLKLKEQLIENYKHTADENIEINILDLDKANEPALAYSSIVIAMRHPVLSPLTYNVYTLILEATGNKLTPVVINMNGKQVERIRTASAAYDNVLKDKIYKKVQSISGGADKINLVGATVVPDFFDVDDAFKVHKLALNAGLACYTGFALNSEEFVDIDLTDVDRSDVLVVGNDFARRELEDPCGNKMRSDVLVTFEARKDNVNQYNSVNAGDREINISEVSGFIDLLYSPPAPTNPYMGMPQQSMQGLPTQKYAARFIVTNLNSNIPYTFRSILLALSTAMSIKTNNAWIQVFKPSLTSDKEIDLTDIGALNIDANLMNEPSGFGTRIKTKSDSFKLEDLGQFISDVIKPNLLLSIDCPIVGPQSWYLDNFSEGALATVNPSIGNADINDIIYKAAVELTGGNFARYFNQGSPIFEPILEYVHNGYWTDKNGNTRDIRDIDYIAVCNLVGDKNPQYIREWSDTFTCLDIPLEERMDIRRRMISNLTYDTAVFTGYSQRVTLTTDFLDALSAAIQATGIPVRLDNTLNAMEFFNTRRGIELVSSTINRPGSGFGQVGFGQNYSAPGFDPRLR